MNVASAKFFINAPKFFTNPIFKSIPLVEKISKLTLKYFDLGQNTVITFFGLKETIFDFPKFLAKQSLPADTKVKRIYIKIFKVISRQSLGHGAFYILSGTAGASVALSDLGLFSLGKFYPFLNFTASVSFIIANLISLERNVKIFQYADKIIKEGTADKTLPKRLKISSVMGIINHVGYISASILILFPPTTALAMIIGLFSIFDGCLKIIFDFFFVTPQLLHS